MAASLQMGIDEKTSKKQVLIFIYKYDQKMPYSELKVCVLFKLWLHVCFYTGICDRIIF